MQEIVPRHQSRQQCDKHFITLCMLRFTCKWFARHITLPAHRTAHEHFWPCVERFARKGYPLRTIEWPTHPRVMLSGYAGPNYSYGRAGGHLAKRGDHDALMDMARHGGGYWTFWLYKAAKHGHGAVLEALYTSGLKCFGSEYTFYHDIPAVVAVDKNRLDM